MLVKSGVLDCLVFYVFYKLFYTSLRETDDIKRMN